MQALPYGNTRWLFIMLRGQLVPWAGESKDSHALQHARKGTIATDINGTRTKIIPPELCKTRYSTDVCLKKIWRVKKRWDRRPGHVLFDFCMFYSN